MGLAGAVEEEDRFVESVDCVWRRVRDPDSLALPDDLELSELFMSKENTSVAHSPYKYCDRSFLQKKHDILDGTHTQ